MLRRLRDFDWHRLAGYYSWRELLAIAAVGAAMVLLKLWARSQGPFAP